MQHKQDHPAVDPTPVGLGGSLWWRYWRGLIPLLLKPAVGLNSIWFNVFLFSGFVCACLMLTLSRNNLEKQNIFGPSLWTEPSVRIFCPVCANLAFSYILTVIRVSSIVLLTNVLMLDTKKLTAPSKVSPFLHSSFWVSALYPNSSYKGGKLLFVWMKSNTNRHQKATAERRQQKY